MQGAAHPLLLAPGVLGGVHVVLASAGAPSRFGAALAALDGAWLAIRPVARPAMIDSGTGGKLLLLAPPPGGAHAAAARAGLENLARTLSVEWARFGVRPFALHLLRLPVLPRGGGRLVGH